MSVLKTFSPDKYMVPEAHARTMEIFYTIYFGITRLISTANVSVRSSAMVCSNVIRTTTVNIKKKNVNWWYRRLSMYNNRFVCVVFDLARIPSDTCLYEFTRYSSRNRLKMNGINSPKRLIDVTVWSVLITNSR